MDTSDHINMDINKLFTCGVGPDFPLKLFLGPVESRFDRSSKQKDPRFEMYGERRCSLTKEEMENCNCEQLSTPEPSYAGVLNEKPTASAQI